MNVGREFMTWDPSLCPRLPGVVPKALITGGLTAAAVWERKMIVVGDVRNGPRYRTALEEARAEFQRPGAALSKDGYLIRANVLNLSLL